MHRHLRALRAQLQRHGHGPSRRPVPERESQAPHPRCSPQPAASTRSALPSLGHADPVCCYLLLLQHIVRLFEHQRTDLLRRLQRRPADSGRRHSGGSGLAVAASGQGGAPEDQLGAEAAARGGPGRSSRTDQQTSGGGGDGNGGGSGDRGVGVGGGDYMESEEEAQGAASVAQRLTEELLAAAVPASHLPVVLGLLGPLGQQKAQQAGQGQGHGTRSCGPYHTRVRVLALRALGSLLALSRPLAERHGALVAALLGAAAQQQPTGATLCEAWGAGAVQQEGSASLPAAAALLPAPLVCEAAGMACHMVLADPNRHRALLGRLEGAVLAAVEPLLEQHAEEGAGGGRPACEAQRERSAAVLPVLVRSLCLLLASGRLQWSPSTLRVMAACLLAPEAMRQQVRGAEPWTYAYGFEPVSSRCTASHVGIAHNIACCSPVPRSLCRCWHSLAAWVRPRARPRHAGRRPPP